LKPKELDEDEIKLLKLLTRKAKQDIDVRIIFVKIENFLINN